MSVSVAVKNLDGEARREDRINRAASRRHKSSAGALTMRENLAEIINI
jgi:hypothetical protein